MFCSKCGQEQASESVIFCSSCGCKLQSIEEPVAQRLIKMAMFLVLAACAVMGWASFTAGPAYMQVRIIISLVAVIAFYLLFSRDLKHLFDKLFSDNSDLIGPASKNSVLPSAQGIAVSSLGPRRVNTAEMAPPPSITEHTTSLLDGFAPRATPTVRDDRPGRSESGVD